MRMLKTCNDFLYNMKTPKYVVFMACVGYASSIILLNIIYLIMGINFSQDGGPTYINVLDEILFAIILSPIIETLVFQTFVFTVMKEMRWFKSKEFLIMLFSAVCFSGMHMIYNAYYAMSAFIIGLILAYSFSIYSKKGKKASVVVILIHSFINMISVIFSY
ncbi:CPBP family intramembrane glutamic endopeptidase [Crassaminicella indica]|uniref:CPBP family intramembrane metalloprotease n=1 Tax=Crassaminicella indica TaxID=2855394 RepID=A0ABX8RBQ1_9CLOT|nr:CPBP family intramembrane glutamic endopeptidase [Crassaminicella indica]QXM05140.1 CPBP family intramembrane metalloprotease [Crassaminicella indica]